MDTKKDEIINLAKKAKYYCDLLIEQNDKNNNTKGNGITKVVNTGKYIQIIIGVLLVLLFTSLTSMAYSQGAVNRVLYATIL